MTTNKTLSGNATPTLRPQTERAAASQPASRNAAAQSSLKPIGSYFGAVLERARPQ